MLVALVLMLPVIASAQAQDADAGPESATETETGPALPHRAPAATAARPHPKPMLATHGTHAEALEVEFDPTQTSFRDLLEFFFQIHDPSTPGRQGNDRGSSYRSAIFYTSDEQLTTAQQTIADVNSSGLWPGKVVTEVAPAGPFWEAEPEHQDYLVKHPNGYTCHYPRAGWKLPRREIG